MSPKPNPNPVPTEHRKIKARRPPELTVLAADRFGVLQGLAQLGAVQGSPVAFGKAAVDFSELEVGLGAQVAGLALLHHRDIAAGERRETHLAAPALSGVLGPAVALPPDAEHATKGGPCRCVMFFVGLDDVAHGVSGFYWRILRRRWLLKPRVAGEPRGWAWRLNLTKEGKPRKWGSFLSAGAVF